MRSVKYRERMSNIQSLLSRCRISFSVPVVVATSGLIEPLQIGICDQTGLHKTCHMWRGIVMVPSLTTVHTDHAPPMVAGTPWVIQPLNCEIRNTQPLKQEPGKTIEYEAHVGMAQEEGRIGTYREFADITLKHIKEAGYNTIQLMATMEHPYYGSFGYQVANFFAASSWFGKPDDLKYLVNKAHEMGIRVLLDLVHSHAVKNTAEGIHMFDGAVWQFFHEGG